MHETSTTVHTPNQFTLEKAKRIANTAVGTLVWFFAVAVLLQNLYLQKQIRGLREAQSVMVTKEAYLQAIAPPISLGRRMGNVRGVTEDGKFQEFQLVQHGQTQGTIIITFSPGCIHCLHNQKGWDLLVRDLKQRNWRIIWVSRDPADMTFRYCKSHGIDTADVLADPTYPTYVLLGLARVPNTVVLNGRGEVQQVWAGQISEESWRDLFAFFELPPPSSLLTSAHLATE
jgi:hypothetical protein